MYLSAFMRVLFTFHFSFLRMAERSRLAALQGILEADEAAIPHEPITAPNSQHAPDQADAPVTKLKPSLPSPTRMGRREAQLERALREERAARAELRRQQAATESRLREALCALRDARLRLSAREREPQEQRARESWTSCASPNAGACSLLAGGALGNKAGCACEEGTSTNATTTEVRASRSQSLPTVLTWDTEVGAAGGPGAAAACARRHHPARRVGAGGAHGGAGGEQQGAGAAAAWRREARLSCQPLWLLSAAWRGVVCPQ